MKELGGGGGGYRVPVRLRIQNIAYRTCGFLKSVYCIMTWKGIRSTYSESGCRKKPDHVHTVYTRVADHVHCTVRTPGLRIYVAYILDPF